jgi:hypothetical protein
MGVNSKKHQKECVVLRNIMLCAKDGTLCGSSLRMEKTGTDMAKGVSKRGRGTKNSSIKGCIHDISFQGASLSELEVNTLSRERQPWHSF